MQPDRYDDDRLLACALGLDEDPELLAAAAADAGLGARLEAMRADVAAIGAQVSAAVPEPEESYTDLSGDRWGGLKEYFDAPAEAAKPRRERRWWRVLAPVAALVVLALVVGIVAINGGGLTGSSSSTSGSAAQTADNAAPAQGFSGAGATTGGDDRARRPPSASASATSSTASPSSCWPAPGRSAARSSGSPCSAPSRGRRPRWSSSQ